MAKKRIEEVTEQASTGLGDTVEKVFKATGIDKLAKFVLGEDCGCEERKEKLNKLFPYIKPLCLTEDEFNTLDAYFKENTNTLTHEQQKSMLLIYNRIFKARNTLSSCTSCLRDLVNKLRTIHGEYANAEG